MGASACFISGWAATSWAVWALFIPVIWKTVAHLTGVVAWIVSIGDLFISCCADTPSEDDEERGLSDSRKDVSVTSPTKSAPGLPTASMFGSTAGTTAAADAGAGFSTNAAVRLPELAATPAQEIESPAQQQTGGWNTNSVFTPSGGWNTGTGNRF